jgi:hypothetical protein
MFLCEETNPVWIPRSRRSFCTADATPVIASICIIIGFLRYITSLNSLTQAKTRRWCSGSQPKLTSYCGARRKHFFYKTDSHCDNARCYIAQPIIPMINFQHHGLVLHAESGQVRFRANSCVPCAARCTCADFGPMFQQLCVSAKPMSNYYQLAPVTIEYYFDSIAGYFTISYASRRYMNAHEQYRSDDA